MESVTQTEPDVKTAISAIIRDWQRRTTAGSGPRTRAQRIRYITTEIVSGGWATAFVVDMARLEGCPVTASEVQAVAQELAQAQAVAK